MRKPNLSEKGSGIIIGCSPITTKVCHNLRQGLNHRVDDTHKVIYIDIYTYLSIQGYSKHH